MKKTFIKISMACFCAGLIFTSCSKNSDNSVTPATENQQTAGSDDTRAQNESDAGANDAETAVSSNSSTKRVSAGGSVVAGATIDSSNASGQKKIVITYDGSSNIGGRTRSGSITVQLTSGTHWSDQGAVMTLTYYNYKATRTSDNKSIIINGSETIRNTSGGLISTMTIADSRTRSIRSSNLSITFDNGTQRTWSVAKKRTITTQVGGTYTIKTMGDTIVSGHGDASHHVSAWGTTRFGTQFYTIITDSDPITWNTANCVTAPTSGTISVEGLANTLTVNYGVDSNGNPVTTATCSYGIKLSWTVTGVTQTAVVVY
ncbi:MAG TPA: hypothetical protein VK750_03515 [Cytophagaceae bacterium]|jgi:hypothetical protein|nr:hypothetical protein [Cytophagaceae bacterium]